MIFYSSEIWHAIIFVSVIGSIEMHFAFNVLTRECHKKAPVSLFVKFYFFQGVLLLCRILSAHGIMLLCLLQ
jgi:hypothetical protein